MTNANAYNNLGPFQRLEVLGAGGMGTVYKGLDTRTDEFVAIKELRRDLFDDVLIERFKREGEALRDLNHPNIVKMLDAIEQDGHHYLVMEYIAGGDLASLITRYGRFNYRHCLDMAIDLADALTRAHRLNIIHRDLKPTNVLIGEDGTLRLTDFGLAHIGSKKRLTERGELIGSVAYTPPEAFVEPIVDERGDIWSFGVVLYEMLTGVHPFERSMTSAMMMAIVNAPPPDFEALAPDVPTALADLIYRMLEKDALARIPSVRIIGAELENLLYGREYGAQTRFPTPTPVRMLRRQTNLPTHTTPFVGRESELEALVRILNSPAGRLITVLAPGGVGKTRLAAELARQNLEAFEDGVFLVDLTALTASAHIIIAVAEAVTLPLVEGKRTPKQQLLDFLSGRQILLVMDNCEHLIDELSLITEILETAEHVKILATSRRRLELAGETVFHLYGLDLRDCETPEEALTHAAVKLFVNSAVRINPTFRLTAHNLKAVIQICHLTAGMPLGIVLAAGWLAMLSPEEIAAEITQSIGFLEATGSKVSERQRSIQAVLDYSWQMLSEDEQHIAQKLSIFHGGFTRDAAQTVTGATLHQLMNLVTQSIIRRNIETGHYSIHELMRQYAEEKLSVSGDYQVVCSAHLTYYAAWMRERLPMLLGPREFDALNAIEADFENVRAAWQWGVASESWPQLREIVEPLSLFAVMRVRMDDVFPLFRQVINRFMPSEALNEAEASLLSWVVGWYANVEDTPHTEFEQTARYGLEIAHRLQDRRAIAWCLYRLVESAYIQGHMQEAIRLGDEAIALFRELGDNAGLFIALCDSGVFHSMTGSEVLSIIRTEESLSIARTMGSKLRIGRALNNIAANLPPHRSDEAIEMHNEALRLWQELNSPHRIGWILGVIAITALIALRRDDATAPLQQMKSIAHDTDDPGVNYTVHGLEMFLNFADERYAEALAASEQALVCAERIGNYAAVHNVRAARCALLAMLDAFDACREGLKVSAPLVTGVFGFDLINLFNVSFATLRLIERAGDDQTCLELLSAHLHHADIWPYFREHPYIVRLQARLRLDLDTEVYQAAWERGKTRDLETYVQTLIAAME